MSKIIKAESTSVVVGLLVRLTLDPWLLMLALGGLSHQLHHQFLAIGFWASFLIVVAVQSVSSSQITKWKIENE